MLNGFPLRLVVPGWYATYWVKALHGITVLPEKFRGFWMDKAYRIPNTPNANEQEKETGRDSNPLRSLHLFLTIPPEVAFFRFPILPSRMVFTIRA